MDRSDRCRNQADECRRLLLHSQSGAEATILTSLTRSCYMIATQTDRYTAIMKRRLPGKAKARFSRESEHVPLDG
jgi:hypothetical protein